MRKKKIYFLILILIFFFSYSFIICPLNKNLLLLSECEIKNQAFSSGEELAYEVWYNWGFLWMESGIVTFKVQKDNYKEIPCYRLSGVGGTLPKYDWFFTVRDSFFAWVDSSSMRPYRCVRIESEGQRFIHEDSYFNYGKKKAYTVTREKKKMPRIDSLNITGCSYDVLTLIYYSRNIDFSKYNVNDTIPLDMFLENKIYPTYLRYLGKEVYDVEGVGKFNCIKFRAKLIEGTLFTGGENMTVWVTDDKNRIPLYVEAPILVGSVKAKIHRWKGLKNKMESKL